MKRKYTRRFASGELVPIKWHKLYDEACKKAGTTGISQSFVTVNDVLKVISSRYIDEVAYIIGQVGGVYHGSIIVIS